MRKATFLILTLAFANIGFAQGYYSPITIDIGTAVTIEAGDNIITTINNESSLLTGPLNMFKVGAYIDGLYIISNTFSAGGELGFYTFTTEDNTATALFDIPALIVFKANLSGVLKVKAHLGYTMSSHITSTHASGIEIVNKLDIGAKVFFGDLFLDYTQLSWGINNHSVKWGLGYELNIY